MKQYKVFAMCGIIAALSLTGCSNEETTYNEDNRVALRVSSGIQTRAVDDMWESDDAIGIYMLDKGNLDTYANIQYTTQDNDRDGSFAPANETIYLPTDGSERDFIAYYPWTNALKDNVYTIDLTKQDDQSAIDLMVAEKVTGISRYKNSAEFQFAHKLSKIVMAIEPGADISESDLEGIEIRLTNQHTTGTYDVLNGSAAVAGQTTGYIALKVGEKGTSAEAIVFPSANYNGMNFEFTTKYVGYYSCPVPNTHATDFMAGKKYKYTIIINKTGLNVSAEITDWQTGNGAGGDTGYAE